MAIISAMRALSLALVNDCVPVLFLSSMVERLSMPSASMAITSINSMVVISVKP